MDLTSIRDFLLSQMGNANDSAGPNADGVSLLLFYSPIPSDRIAPFAAECPESAKALQSAAGALLRCDGSDWEVELYTDAGTLLEAFFNEGYDIEEKPPIDPEGKNDRA